MCSHPVALLAVPDFTVSGLEGLLGNGVQRRLQGLARGLVPHDDSLVGFKGSCNLLADEWLVIVLLHVVEEGVEERMALLSGPGLLEVGFLPGDFHSVELVHVAIKGLELVDLARVGSSVLVTGVGPGLHFSVQGSLDALRVVRDFFGNGLLECGVLLESSTALFAVPGGRRSGRNSGSRGGGGGWGGCRSRCGVLGFRHSTTGWVAGRSRGLVKAAFTGAVAEDLKVVEDVTLIVVLAGTKANLDLNILVVGADALDAVDPVLVAVEVAVHGAATDVSPAPSHDVVLELDSLAPRTAVGASLAGTKANGEEVGVLEVAIFSGEEANEHAFVAVGVSDFAHGRGPEAVCPLVFVQIVVAVLAVLSTT